MIIATKTMTMEETQDGNVAMASYGALRMLCRLGRYRCLDGGRRLVHVVD